MTYSIEDGYGTTLADGLQEHEAYRVARRVASERGESVYLWAPGADEAEEIEPNRSRKGFAGKRKPWITREGKLGGPGYTKKSAKQRHKILDKCVKEYGYRSCLGSIEVLLRDSEISGAVRKKLTADKNYLKKKYGGPGSFGPQKNPSEPCCDACAIGKPCESGCDDHGHTLQSNPVDVRALKNRLLK